jgi:hypothetical protein
MGLAGDCSYCAAPAIKLSLHITDVFVETGS